MVEITTCVSLKSFDGGTGSFFLRDNSIAFDIQLWGGLLETVAEASTWFFLL